MERFVLCERFTEDVVGHITVFKRFDSESGAEYFATTSSTLGLQDLGTDLCFAGFVLVSAYPIVRGVDRNCAVEALRGEMVKEEKCGHSQFVAFPELALNSAAPLLYASGFYVYVIRQASGRWYVGQSRSLQARLQAHLENFGDLTIHSLEWVATVEEANGLEEIRTAALMTRLPPGTPVSGGSWAVASATSPSKRAAVVAGLCVECGQAWGDRGEWCQSCALAGIKRVRRSWTGGAPRGAATRVTIPVEDETGTKETDAEEIGDDGAVVEETDDPPIDPEPKAERLRGVARGAGSTTWNFGEWKNDPTTFEDMLKTTKGLQACIKVLHMRSKGQYYYGLPALFANYLVASVEATACLRRQAVWKTCRDLPLEDPTQARRAR